MSSVLDTIRSKIQNDASTRIRVKGTADQAKRGSCIQKAMSIFCELGIEGIPRCGFGSGTGLSRATAAGARYAFE